LSRLVKTVSDSDGSRMDAGRLFHTRGPSTAKDRSPNVVPVGGTSSLIVDRLIAVCVCVSRFCPTYSAYSVTVSCFFQQLVYCIGANSVDSAISVNPVCL